MLHVSDGAGAVDVSLDPNNPRIVFATIWQTRRTFWSIDSGGPDSGLWRSRDGGDTWENISHRPGMPDGILGKIGVSVSPARSGRVFAIVEAEGRKRGLYRSDDIGETWEKVSSKPDLGWRPWYYQHVIAHPTDADEVFVMNMKAWRSIDGGKTFEEFHTPHGDNHALWIDPTNPDRMIGCDDGGAWVSFNAGESWSTIYNQLTAQFYHVATDDQFPYMVYGSQQDNSSIAVPSQDRSAARSTGPTATRPAPPRAGTSHRSPATRTSCTSVRSAARPVAATSLQRYDHTTNQIQLVNVWPEEYHDGNTAEVRFQWTYPIVFSPHDSNVLYAAGNKVFRTTDEGHSWQAISPDLTYADPETMGVSGPLTMDTAGAEMYATIFSLMVSAHERGVLMTGSDDGLVHLSTNDGGDWVNVTPPDLAKFSQVTMIAESPHTAGTVYMTAARHKTGDYAPVRLQDRPTSAPRGRGSTAGSRRTSSAASSAKTRIARVCCTWAPSSASTCRSTTAPTGNRCSATCRSRRSTTSSSRTPISSSPPTAARSGSSTTSRRCTRWHDDLFAAEPVPAQAARRGAHTCRTSPLSWGGTPGGKNYHVTSGQNATFYVEELDTGHVRKRVIDGGDDLERGVRIMYFLDEAAVGEASLTITRQRRQGGRDVPERDPRGQEGSPRVATSPPPPGMNSFQWPMTIPRRREDGRHRVPQPTRRTARQARHLHRDARRSATGR